MNCVKNITTDDRQFYILLPDSYLSVPYCSIHTYGHFYKPSLQ